MFKKTLRKWLRRILDSDNLTKVDEAVPYPSSSNVFNKDYEGWNFRIHSAVGGHIVEAWCYDNGNQTAGNSYTKSVSASRSPGHKLFIVTKDEELSVELPNILTALALERA